MVTADRPKRNGDDGAIGSSVVSRSDVQRALAAGFSPDDVAYMLALPAPQQWIEEKPRRVVRG